MNKPQLYDFTDLVLLVGTNPLPNYVVAKFFCIKNNNMQRIWLLYSEKSEFYEGTQQYADNIEAVLKELKIEIIKCPLSNISQAEKIFNQVKEHLTKRIKDINKIHLNYTGGTKAMAVHTYRALENALKDQWGNNFSASYLDARDFNIKFDLNPEKTTGDLRKEIQLEWDKLFYLHNNEIISSNKEYLYSNPTQQALIMESIAQMASKNKILDFRSWVNLSNRDNSNRDSALDRERSLFNKPKYDNKSSEDIEKIINNRLSAFTPNDNPELFTCLAAFPEKDRFANQNGNWIYNNFGISGKAENSELLMGFLTGKWLEAYVAWVLRKKIKENKLERSDVMTNYELTTKQGYGSHKFEVDVLVTNGYQITGISCGTSLDNKQKIPPTIKTKGFEVILRSSQMGGDEARAVLVTLLEAQNVVNLENDLKASLGANGSRFIVLGINDLSAEKMWNKLKKHIYE